MLTPHLTPHPSPLTPHGATAAAVPETLRLPELDRWLLVPPWRY